MTFVADTCQSGQAAGPKPDQDKKDMAKDIDAKPITSICAAETGLAFDARSTPHVSVFEAIKTWPYAVMWSAVFSSTLVMVSYTPSWISQLYALPAFTTRFGYDYDGTYVIPARWQSALSACSLLGQFFGAPVIAVLMDKFSLKLMFMAALVLLASSVFIQFFSTSLPILVAGTLLIGLSLSSYGVLSLTYAMKVSPLPLHGVLGAFYSFDIVTGPLLAAAVAQGVVNMASVWAYRISFAITWAWPFVLLPVSFFTPESPMWLIRQGRTADAEAALQRLAISDFDISPDLARMAEIDRQEQAFENSTTYKEIFKGSNLRHTIIATGCYSIIINTGASLTNGGSYFMIYQFIPLAGVDAETSFLWSLGAGLGALLGAFISLWILAKCLRRPVYIWSQLISTGLLFIIGFTQLDPKYYERKDILSPVSTVIMGEVPSNALRSKTVAFATAVQIVISVLILTIYPYLLGPDSKHLQGYIGFIAGASSLVYTIWTFFYVPETSLTIETLDMLFTSEVNARHFTTFEVNQLEGTTDLP
ncbi:hypothetical protein NCS52_00915100 [Fusarium sp. LHS14.1]|nr:hypothetical protein NCS52_00915100 [Fusarium sp. LHS14.1]